MDVHLAHRTIGSVALLDVSGELDLSTVPRLHGELVRLVADHNGTTVAVDLDGVTSLDDAALGVLLGAAGRAREAGGDLVVVCSDHRLRARFTATRFDRAVDVVPTVNDVAGSPDASADGG